MTQQREDLAWLRAQPYVTNDEIQLLGYKLTAVQKTWPYVSPIYATEVCRLFHVRMEDLMSKCRTDHVAAARAVLYYALREITKLSFPKIGEITHRDHSTVVLGDRKVRKHMAKETGFRDMMCDLVACINAKIAESVQPEAMVQ